MIRKDYLLLLSLSIFVMLNVCLNHQLLPVSHDKQPAPIRFSSQILKVCSMDYDNLIATWVWFQAIAYYGANIDDTDYDYLASLLHNISRLNPKFKPVYYMASSVFPWGTNNTKLSRPFVMQAMIEFPTDWRWAYYRGFNAYWFDHNSELAAHYFEISAMKPQAPPLVTSLALRMHSHAGNLQTGLDFLKSLLQKKNDSKLQAQLLEQYHQLQTEQQLRAIERLLETLPQRHLNMSDLNQLRQQGYHIPNKLADGGYIHMLKDGSLLSSKTKKRFKLFVPEKHQGVQTDATH